MWDRILDAFFGGEPPYGPSKTGPSTTGPSTTGPASVRLVARTAGPQTRTLIVGEQHTAAGERAFAEFNQIVAKRSLVAERRDLLRELRTLMATMGHSWYHDADERQKLERARKIVNRLSVLGEGLDQ